MGEIIDSGEYGRLKDRGEPDQRLRRCPLCKMQAFIRNMAGEGESPKWRIACRGTFHSPPWHVCMVWHFGTRLEAITLWNKGTPR